MHLDDGFLELHRKLQARVLLEDVAGPIPPLGGHVPKQVHMPLNCVAD